jgi:hypothetical protein
MWSSKTPRYSGRAHASVALQSDAAAPAAHDPRVDALHARLDRAAQAEQRLRVNQLDRVWLKDDELGQMWIATLPWAQESDAAGWNGGNDAIRRELLQNALDVEVGRRLPAVRQMRDGWDLVRVPRWELEKLRAEGRDGGNLLAGDNVLYTARCRHGLLIPPNHGGQCPLGCQVADAFA